MTEQQQQDFAALCREYRLGVVSRSEFLAGARCFLPSIDWRSLERVADQVLTNTNVTFGSATQGADQ